MNKLESYELKVNTPSSKQIEAQEKLVEKYLRVVDDISRVMYRAGLTLDEAATCLESASLAIEHYRQNGYYSVRQVENE